MCGISAIYNYAGINQPIDQELLDRLDQLQVFRGPDGNGKYINHEQTVGLAHRRLSIIDIAETGAQPMASPNGRYTITFNGCCVRITWSSDTRFIGISSRSKSLSSQNTALYRRVGKPYACYYIVVIRCGFCSGLCN